MFSQDLLRSYGSLARIDLITKVHELGTFSKNKILGELGKMNEYEIDPIERNLILNLLFSSILSEESSWEKYWIDNQRNPLLSTQNEIDQKLKENEEARANLGIQDSNGELKKLFLDLEKLRPRVRGEFDGNVHGGDRWTKPEVRAAFAIQALRIVQSSSNKPEEITKAKDAFVAYLKDLQEDSGISKTTKTLALLALFKQISESMSGHAPLLDPSQLIFLQRDQNAIETTGDEYIGRVWLFIKTYLKDPDQKNAITGMIRALSSSIEDKYRVCNPGKVSRIAASAIQGYFPGFEDPSVASSEGTMNGLDAINAFFRVKDHQGQCDRKKLLTKAFAWEKAQLRSINRREFLEQLKEFLDVEE